VEDKQQKVAELRADVIPVKPIYEPYNQAAKDVVDLVFSQLKLTESRPTSIAKQKIVIASILAITQKAFNKVDGVIAIPSNNNYWSEFPHVGKDIVYRVRDALVEAGFITFIPETGKVHFWDGDDGSLKSMGLLSCYDLDDSLSHLKGFVDAEFVETGRATVLVSVPETRGQRILRERNNKRREKMKKEEVLKAYGKAYTIHHMEVERLLKFWSEHPLALPPLDNGFVSYAACATRVFHDGRLDSGGRFYGAWTPMSSAYRLQGTIDGEPLAEVDLNASQPTLFSSMVGIPLKIGKGMWEDLYEHILDKVDLTDVDVDDDKHTRRAKAKQVTVEVIGSGNHNKSGAAADGKNDFALGEYARYRNALIDVVPALRELDAEYKNGAGYISFHEAQIMTLTLLYLRDKGVVAYPIHDCLLVKDKEAMIAADAYRQCVRAYIKEYGEGDVDVTVPVSIERKDQDKERITGYYHNL